MNLNVKEMLESYKNVAVSELDKLREILQQAALLGLYRSHFFDHAAFYGGTALRILWGLGRFSEDLDFSLLKKDAAFDLSPFLDGLEKEMESMGFRVKVAEKEKSKKTGVLSAFLKTSTIDLLLSIEERNRPKNIHPEQQLKIKLEIDTDPPPGFRTTLMLVREPSPFHVLSYQLQDLFAGKMHAILFRAWKNRVKGRDWFDLVWFIQKAIPLNLRHLNQRLDHLGQSTISSREKLLETLEEKIRTIDWGLAKKDVRAFIPDPRTIEAWSPKFFSDLLQFLKIEN